MTSAARSIFSGLLLSVLVLAAAAPRSLTGQNRVITPDSALVLDLPASFHPVQVNAVAQIQYGDSTSDSFVLAILESKEDLFGWNLTRHSMITVAQALVALDFPEVEGPVEKEISGFPARQYLLRGVSQGTRIVYLHTTIDTPESFAQIVAWTSRSRWKDNESVLRGIVESAELTGSPLGALASDAFSIVPGTWVWEDDEDGCDGKTQTFVIGEDSASMVIRHAEPYERSDGTMTDETHYVIEGSTPTVLNTYIPDETRLTDEGDPVKWDLVVVGRNRLAWHRTDWAAGGLTKALVRCPSGS